MDSVTIRTYQKNGRKWDQEIRQFPDLHRAYLLEKERQTEKCGGNKKRGYEEAVKVYAPKLEQRQKAEKERAASGKGPWDDLYVCDYHDFDGKPKINLRGSLEWVLENVLVRDAEQYAPSKLALGYLSSLRRMDPAYVTDKFMMDYGARLMPSRADIDKEDALHDDGAGVDRTLQLIADVSGDVGEAA